MPASHQTASYGLRSDSFGDAVGAVCQLSKDELLLIDGKLEILAIKGTGGAGFRSPADATVTWRSWSALVELLLTKRMVLGRKPRSAAPAVVGRPNPRKRSTDRSIARRPGKADRFGARQAAD